MKFWVARELHKTLGEIEAMPADEFDGWLAYLGKIEPELRKKAEKKARGPGSGVPHRRNRHQRKAP